MIKFLAEIRQQITSWRFSRDVIVTNAWVPGRNILVPIKWQIIVQLEDIE